MILSSGYETDDADAAENINENEIDEGWCFPIPRAELHSQLMDLNERAYRGDEYPEVDFWRDRPVHQDITEEDDEGLDSSGLGDNDCVCEQDPCICSEVLEYQHNEVLEAEIATIRRLLDQFQRQQE